MSLHGVEQKKVFILHSYAQEYSWTKRQHEGFIKRLNENKDFDFQISSEYLDTKRISFTLAYQEVFFEYLKVKYRNYQPDVIYCSDDNALNFLREYKKELYGETPVIFSGINNLSLPDTLQSYEYRGIFESKEVEPNIKLINHFSQQAKEVYFIGDNSSTYQDIKRDIKKKMLTHQRLTPHYLASENIDTIIESLKTLPRSFAILTTIGNFKDNHANSLTLSESIKKLSSLKNIIILTMEDAYMLPGVLGGYVTSGMLHGEIAANMALKLLNGLPIEKMSSTLEGQYVYMFNEKEVYAKGFILSQYIARDAIIINKKESFWKDTQESSLFVIIFFLLLAIMILSFLAYYFYQESESKPSN
jgi:UDP-2,3-diacylglucosamine pyrophosphatase LpxH